MVIEERRTSLSAKRRKKVPRKSQRSVIIPVRGVTTRDRQFWASPLSPTGTKYTPNTLRSLASLNFSLSSLSPHLHPPLPSPPLPSETYCLVRPYVLAVESSGYLFCCFCLALAACFGKTPQFASARSIWTRPPETPSSQSWRISLVNSSSAGSDFV